MEAQELTSYLKTRLLMKRERLEHRLQRHQKTLAGHEEEHAKQLKSKLPITSGCTYSVAYFTALVNEIQDELDFINSMLALC